MTKSKDLTIKLNDISVSVDVDILSDQYVKINPNVVINVTLKNFVIKLVFQDFAKTSPKPFILIKSLDFKIPQFNQSINFRASNYLVEKIGQFVATQSKKDKNMERILTIVNMVLNNAIDNIQQQLEESINSIIDSSFPTEKVIETSNEKAFLLKTAMTEKPAILGNQTQFMRLILRIEGDIKKWDPKVNPS